MRYRSIADRLDERTHSFDGFGDGAKRFAQFCVDDYEQTRLIDMRFFRGSVEKYVEEHSITEVLVLYNVPNFTADLSVARCADPARN